LMSNKAILTVASWEPRFWLGFQQLLNQHAPANVTMFFYAEFSFNSASTRRMVRELCDSRQIVLRESELSFGDPVSSFKAIYRTVAEVNLTEESVVIDITTMPREVIWILLDLLDGQAATIDWAYHRPERYNDEWLSRDPDRPRFVPKMGGVPKLGAPTKLLIMSGFDIERTKQVMIFYEPEITLIGVQSGSQFGNQEMNVSKHEREFKHSPGVKLFETNAYSIDQGYSAIEQELRDHVGNANVIMTSLGPKPSAIALYRLHKLHEATSLAYAPSKEFNIEYSYGISNTITGRL
jgi:hypothetical protein